jgi:ribonuclease P protein component
MHDESSRHSAMQPEPQRDVTLPRHAILRGRTAFAAVFSSGLGLRSGRIVVKYRIVDAATRRVLAGFVLRRGSGNAVRRNRLKRLMREAYRFERSELERRLPRGIELHLVFIWSGSPDEAARERLEFIRNDLSTALRRIIHRLRARNDERNNRQTND